LQSTFSPDSTLLASCAYDAVVKVWDINTNNCTISLDMNNFKDKRVNAVAFFNKNLLATAGHDATLRLWDLRNETPVAQFPIKGACSALVIGSSKVGALGDSLGNIFLLELNLI